MKLYELAGEYQAFADAVEAEEIPLDAIADTLESLRGDIAVKLDNLACWCKSLRAEADAMDAELSALQTRRDRKRSTAKSVTDAMLAAMERVGMDKLETARSRVAIRANPEAVEITDLEKFIRYAQEHDERMLKYTAPEPVKVHIKALLRSGEDVPFARLVRSRRLEIK